MGPVGGKESPYLLPFIHAEAIDIKHSDLYARKVLDLFSYGWLPLTKSILHGGELGDLPLPVNDTSQLLLWEQGTLGNHAPFRSTWQFVESCNVAVLCE